MHSLFYVIAFAVFALLHLVIYFLFFRKLVSSTFKRRILVLLLLLNFSAVVLYFLGKYGLSQGLSAWLALSVGICFTLFVVTCVYQCLRALSFIDPSRRESFQKGINLFSGALAGGYIGWGLIEAKMLPQIEKVTLAMRGLSSDFTAVQLSDLHIGGLIHASRVAQIVDEVLSLQAEVIFLTGDIIDTQLEAIQDALVELKRLRAPLGVYYILGNHEYFHGVHAILQTIRDLGFRVLENESIILRKNDNPLVNIAGVYDLFGDRFGDLKPNLSMALAQRDGRLPCILLAHQPKFISRISPQDKIDLILSGHTHGGQIFPFGLFVRLEQPYLAGLYRHDDETLIYVNRGTGFWGPPMRVLSRAEITHFRFLKA